MKRCPFCAEDIRDEAVKCRYCASMLPDDDHRLLCEPCRAAAALGELRDVPESAASEEINATVLRVDALALEAGDDLATMADPDVDGSLLEGLRNVRRRIAMEYGVITPGIRVRPRPELRQGDYQIRVKGDLVAEGEVLVDHLLCIGHDLDVPGIDGTHVEDPVYGTPAVWVPLHQRAVAERAGLQLFDPQHVVSTHVAEIIKQHLDELLTREEVSELLNMARQNSPTVVAELVPNLLALGQIRQVLQNLVRERVPVKDLSTILNTLADQAYHTKDTFQLTEFVRQSLGRKICQRYQTPDGTLKAFMLSPGAERTIQNSIQLNESGQFLALDPDTSQPLHNNLAAALQEHRGQVLDPVIICPPRIRRFVKKLFERTFTELVVLSYAEIVPGVQVENLALIELSPDGETRAAGMSDPPKPVPLSSNPTGWLIDDWSPVEEGATTSEHDDRVDDDAPATEHTEDDELPGYDDIKW